jgi:hypothetical protein
LAAKLTGWKIDVRGPEAVEEEKISSAEATEGKEKKIKKEMKTKKKAKSTKK